ncbi:hypothetical protein NBRC3293_3073 [Gluconobacter oxydans NBRC 3293]|uniref:Uncharacterized protein n=1 Tax=Gluconobacter oxydans NBRC 3293 TaxID=1315969 RepID=A0A829XE19_GLUOY|nr:hypothetical protein NBRC3293_2978 [Gluconobacter oxydans NBRC 3293]GEM18576.1 hypothetical protein NBRC3293_3073 [Gluconobacter oxydans NBRC 3293]
MTDLEGRFRQYCFGHRWSWLHMGGGQDYKHMVSPEIT